MFRAVIHNNDRITMNIYFNTHINNSRYSFESHTVSILIIQDHLYELLCLYIPRVLSNIIISYCNDIILLKYNCIYNSITDTDFILNFDNVDMFKLSVIRDMYYVYSCDIPKTIVEGYQLYASDYLPLFNYYVTHRYGIQQYIKFDRHIPVKFIDGKYRIQHGSEYRDYRIVDHNMFTKIIVVIKMILDMII